MASDPSGAYGRRMTEHVSAFDATFLELEERRDVG
jgi:hypothetical protein